jgi:predicted phosphodiesterase
VRVAALADIHGNAPALEAVLPEVERERPDLIVFCGDLTWGALPEETLALLEPLRDRARFVQGNSEHDLLAWLAGKPVENGGERIPWMIERHSRAADFLGTYEEAVVVDVDGLGSTRFVHGSPRSVIEVVTERTPTERVREFMDGVRERAIVTAHMHVQYDRVVDGVRLLSPGSVGLPYEGRQGAYWAMLGPDVELRRTEYDVDAAVERLRSSTLPSFADRELPLLLEPLSRDEAIEHGESVVFSG